MFFFAADTITQSDCESEKCCFENGYGCFLSKLFKPDFLLFGGYGFQCNDNLNGAGGSSSYESALDLCQNSANVKSFNIILTQMFTVLNNHVNQKSTQMII